MDECCKLAQKESKTRYNWVGKVIHWKLCKKFRFDHTNKWYMHNPASAQENETRKLLSNCDIQKGHQMSTRRSDFMIINNNKKKKKKITCRIVDFAVPADNRVKLKRSEKRDKYLDLARELKKLWNMKVTMIPIVIDALVNRHQRISIRTGGLANNRTSGDRPNYCIIEIGQNTEKSTDDLQRHAVTQSPVRNHQRTLVWKTLKREQIIIIIIPCKIFQL